MKRIFVGITGASGHAYAAALIRSLARAGVAVDVSVTEAGCKVLRHELGVDAGVRGERLTAGSTHAAEELARWLGADGGRRLADVLALALSALAFAAFHFRRFTHWLWEGGIAFSWPTFLWISGAGVLLGLIYRLRGPGVAAGAHGLFNLGLLIGIDPEVLT